MQDAEGTPLYLLIYLRDVTERKSLEDQLRRRRRWRRSGQLAGGIAHDFNNLLTAILGQHRAAAARAPAIADPRRDDVQEISRAAHRAAALARQLLAFSRKQVLQPRLVEPQRDRAEMGGMLRRRRRRADRAPARSRPALGDVIADPGQLEQVIVNLGVNARDAMPDGRHAHASRTANVSRLGVPGAGRRRPAARRPARRCSA